MTRLGVWQLVLSRALFSNPLVGIVPFLLCSLHAQCFAFLLSWCETCFSSSYCSLSVCGGLELVKDTRLSTLYPL